MKKRVKDKNTEINPYEVDKLSKVPSVIKIVILKYWAAAAACFLLFGVSELGFNLYSEGEYIQVETTGRLFLLLGLFLALFMNYIVRIIVRMSYNRRDNTYRYNMVNCRGLKSFGLALLYNFMMTILIFILIVYVLSPNGLVLDPFGTTGGIGIEPFTTGFLYLALDAVFLVIKNLIVMAYQRIKYNKQLNSNFKLVLANEEK